MAIISASGHYVSGSTPETAIVLGYNFALEYYRALRSANSSELHEILGTFYPDEILGSLNEESISADTSLRPLNPPSNSAQLAKRICGILGIKGPIDILVGKSSGLRNSKAVCCHIWNGPIPRGLVYEIEHGIFLCSPELVFLQLSNSMSQVNLYELAYELCGHYTIAPFPGGIFYQTKSAVTTPSRLQKIASLATNLKGLSKARLASRFVLGASASPMESQQAILLGTPRTHGGYGIKGMKLNHKIDLPYEARMMASRGYVVLDAYLPSAQTCIEYQGKHHNQAVMRSSDDSRATALELIGIKTIRIWSDTLYNKQRMDSIARLLVQRSGTRQRKPSFKMETKLTSLIDELRDSSLRRLEDATLLRAA